MLPAPVVALVLAAALLASPAPRPSSPARDEAAAAFRSGIEAFEARNFDAAAEHFERAHELAPHPATLYNLALALEQTGELIPAWQAYLEVERTGITEADRDEAGRDRRRLEDRLAVLELYAEPRDRLCLDGEPIPTTGEGRFRTATTEGDHDLVLDQRSMPITLLRGHTRVLHLQDIEQLWGPGAKSPDRTTLAIHTTATSASVLTLALGGAALAQRTTDGPGTGLLAGAIVTASVAALAGVAAGIQLFKTHQRNAAATAPEPAISSCPPHPALSDSLAGAPPRETATPLNVSTTASGGS